MSTPALKRPFEIIRGGYRACGRYYRAWRELRRLPARRTACEKRLTDALSEIGDAARECGTGSQLPEFAALGAAGAQTHQADALLSEKLAMLQAAQASSSGEIADTSAALEKAKGDSAATLAAASAAHQAHQAAQTRLTALEEEQRTAQTRREELEAKVTDAGEPLEKWQARLSAATTLEAEQKNTLSAALQKEKETAAASQSDANTVATGTGPVQLAQEAREARARREACEAALAETRQQMEKARNRLALRSLRTRLGELDDLQKTAVTALEQASAAYHQKYAAAQAASQAQQHVQAAADEAKTRGTATVAAAKAAHAEAAGHSTTAGETVRAARLALGKVLFAGALRPQSAGAAFANAEAATAELVALDAASAGLRQELKSSRKSAGYTALGTVAAAAVLITTAIFLTKGGGEHSPPSANTNDSAAVSPARELTPEELCRERLGRLAKAVTSYKLINDGPPQKLSVLFFENFVESVSDFSCPSSGKPPGAHTNIDEWTDFTLAPLPGGGSFVVREKAPRHGSRTILAAMPDGSIRELPAP